MGTREVWRLLDQRAGDVAEVPVAGPIPLDVDTSRGLTGPSSRHESEIPPRWLPVCRDAWHSGWPAVDYLVDEGLATSMFLALRLPQPLLLEGEAGVGKTEAARSLASRARYAADPPAVLRGNRLRGRRCTNGTTPASC